MSFVRISERSREVKLYGYSDYKPGDGQELDAHGIREFLNIKTVWIKDEAGATLTETE